MVFATCWTSLRPRRCWPQARSQDILARTQVLTALADLAFRAGDSIQGQQISEVARKP